MPKKEPWHRAATIAAEQRHGVGGCDGGQQVAQDEQHHQSDRTALRWMRAVAAVSSDRTDRDAQGVPEISHPAAASDTSRSLPPGAAGPRSRTRSARSRSRRARARPTRRASAARPRPVECSRKHHGCRRRTRQDLFRRQRSLARTSTTRSAMASPERITGRFSVRGDCARSAPSRHTAIFPPEHTPQNKGPRPSVAFGRYVGSRSGRSPHTSDGQAPYASQADRLRISGALVQLRSRSGPRSGRSRTSATKGRLPAARVRCISAHCEYSGSQNSTSSQQRRWATASARLSKTGCSPLLTSRTNSSSSPVRAPAVRPRRAAPPRDPRSRPPSPYPAVSGPRASAAGPRPCPRSRLSARRARRSMTRRNRRR